MFTNIVSTHPSVNFLGVFEFPPLGADFGQVVQSGTGPGMAGAQRLLRHVQSPAKELVRLVDLEGGKGEMGDE